jgi:DNA-binding transcriptional ArsR family regulator
MARFAEVPLAPGALFELLAHPERRRLLARLGTGEAASGVLARATGVSWPQASRHLGLLEAAHLVSVRRRGRERIYRLERERLKRAAEAWLAELLAGW